VAIDIVCGKTIDAASLDAAVTTVPGGAPETDPSLGTKRFYNGKWYYFCSLACRQKFVAAPGDYIAT
jgi:hypothetical protein